MIRVRSHGESFTSRFPATGQITEQTVIVFEETGKRQGANPSLTSSSELLDRLLGDETGLPQIRTHSQPVLKEKAHLLPVGKELPGFINRQLHSRAQMWNQIGRPPRMIDGRPTFFKTLLEDTPKDDVDMRDTNEVLAKTNPELFQNIQVRVSDVQTTATVADNNPVMAGGEEQPALIQQARRRNR